MKQWVDKYKLKRDKLKDDLEFIFSEKDFKEDKQCDEAFLRFLDKIYDIGINLMIIQFAIGFFGLYKFYVQTLL